MQFVDDHWERNRKKLTRRWNGRQIKNAFQTAIALATWDFKEDKETTDLRRPELTGRHFRIVSQTSAHFDNYLSKVHDLDDQEDTFGTLAQREGLRADEVRDSWRRDSSALKSGARRNVTRGNARNMSEVSEDEEEVDPFDDEDERVRERERERRRRRKPSTKMGTDDEDGGRKGKSNIRARAKKDEYSEAEESEEKPRRKSKPKREEYSEAEESRERPRRKSKPQKEDYSDEESEEKPRRKSKPKIEVSDPVD